MLAGRLLWRKQLTCTASLWEGTWKFSLFSASGLIFRKQKPLPWCFRSQTDNAITSLVDVEECILHKQHPPQLQGQFRWNAFDQRVLARWGQSHFCCVEVVPAESVRCAPKSRGGNKHRRKVQKYKATWAGILSHWSQDPSLEEFWLSFYSAKNFFPAFLLRSKLQTLEGAQARTPLLLAHMTPVTMTSCTWHGNRIIF